MHIWTKKYTCDNLLASKTVLDESVTSSICFMCARGIFSLVLLPNSLLCTMEKEEEWLDKEASFDEDLLIGHGLPGEGIAL